MEVSYPDFRVSLALLSTTQLSFEIEEGPYARTETVDIQVVPLGNSIFAVSWQEKSGATVTNVPDFDRGRVHAFATLPAEIPKCRSGGGEQSQQPWPMSENVRLRSRISVDDRRCRRLRGRIVRLPPPHRLRR